MKTKYCLPYLILIALLCSCEKDLSFYPKTNPRPDCDRCKVLFIGSSYMDYAGNDVIDIFESFARADGKSVLVERAVVGGRRLAGHLEDSITREKVTGRIWDFILLQGNSAFISKKEWFPNIIPVLDDFRELIRKKNKHVFITYIMPWAYLDGLTFIEGETDDYSAMQENIFKNTTETIRSLDIATAPAGWAWYATDPDSINIPLYLPDMNHQSATGAFLTAAVIYCTFYNQVPPDIDHATITKPEREYLIRTAGMVVMENQELWNIY